MTSIFSLELMIAALLQDVVYLWQFACSTNTKHTYLSFKPLKIFCDIVGVSLTLVSNTVLCM